MFEAGQRWRRREPRDDEWDIVIIVGAERVDEVVEPLIAPLTFVSAPIRADVDEFLDAYTTVGVRQPDPDAEHFPWGRVAGRGKYAPKSAPVSYADLLEQSAIDNALERLEELDNADV